MLKIEENNRYNVIVHLEAFPGKQQVFIDEIGKQVENTIRDFPGFISANFLKADDGKTVFNYAQWESEETYKNFLDNDPGEARQVFETYIEKMKSYHPLEVACVIGKN